MNTKRSFILLCVAATLLVVSCFLSSVNAQTCKITNVQPFKCTECKTCTGPSNTCCSETADSAIGTALAIFQFANPSAECASAFKTMSCAICDPKNQQYATNSGIQMCKAKCLEITNACKSITTGIDCTNLPETNCWNSAERISGQSLVLMIVGVLSVVLMF